VEWLSYWHSSAFIISFTVNDVNNCVFVCSNAVYIWLWCRNCSLAVINKRICYVMLWTAPRFHDAISRKVCQSNWHSQFITKSKIVFLLNQKSMTSNDLEKTNPGRNSMWIVHEPCLWARLCYVLYFWSEVTKRFMVQASAWIWL